MYIKELSKIINNLNTVFLVQALYLKFIVMLLNIYFTLNFFCIIITKYAISLNPIFYIWR
ncbi:hypothetical protein, partial [Clostridium neonatale]|uniref:hypothetical protein n=1 Tax=Clostridium neonatale TaxID=137838 RepID=UPI00397C8FAC